MAEDRLFVPMCQNFFREFQLKHKTWELRLRRRQYTAKQIVPGRRVELREGYSGPSLWGTIGQVIEAESVGELLTKVPFGKMLPNAENIERATMMTNLEMGLAWFAGIETPTKMIAFEVILDGK